MAAIFVNDLSANPWVLAETGDATTANIRVYSFTYHEPMESDHVAEIVDIHGRLVVRLDGVIRTHRFDGWVHGVKVDRLDSGYVVVTLQGN